MDADNSKKRRSHYNHSRPIFASIRNSKQNDNTINDAFRKILFYGLGRLHPEWKDEIAVERITFSEQSNGDSTTREDGKSDRRYLIKITENGKLRIAIKKVLFASGSGLLVEGKEEVLGMALLVGGSVIQNLHVDFPPERTSFKGKNNHGEIEGWATNQETYNRVMESTHAPSSVILSMHDEKGLDFVRVGLQYDKIEMAEDGKKCRVKKSTDELFDVVAVQQLVDKAVCTIVDGERTVGERIVMEVVQVTKGVIFTGDFPHAGAVNYDSGTKEEDFVK
jgi:hypothetical protein